MYGGRSPSVQRFPNSSGVNSPSIHAEMATIPDVPEGKRRGVRVGLG